MADSGSYPYTQDSQDMLDSTNGDPDFMNTIITDDESGVYGYDPEPVIFSYNENPTRALNTASLKCCLPLTDSIDRREEFTHAYKGQGPLMQAHFIEIRQVFAKR